MKAWEFLDGHPERWTKGAIARTVKGRKVSAYSARAVSWCLVGALRKSHGTPQGFLRTIDAVRAVVYESLDVWNDAPERTHAEVVAALKEADV